LVAHASLSLKSYYASFKSISGALAVATGVAPVLSLVIKPVASILFPPLGDATIPALAALIALYLAMTFVAYYISGAKMRTALMIVSICAACVSLCFYLVYYMDFVRKIDIPTLSTSRTVSVGYERTPFATQVFPNESDWEMLRARGTDEEDIWKLWTARSIVRARLSLFGAFSSFLLPLVLVFSLGVRNQLSDSQAGAASAGP
jgi:hypothetical protein